VIKQKIIKFFKIIFVSRAAYKRAVLFGFNSSKKMEAAAVFFFLVALPLPKKSAASTSLDETDCKVAVEIICSFIYQVASAMRQQSDLCGLRRF